MYHVIDSSCLSDNEGEDAVVLLYKLVHRVPCSSCNIWRLVRYIPFHTRKICGEGEYRVVCVI